MTTSLSGEANGGGSSRSPLIPLKIVVFAAIAIASVKTAEIEISG
jgi:hypothetical protein